VLNASWIDDWRCLCLGSLSEAEQERDELRAAAAGAEKDGEEAKEQAKQLWDKIQARLN
jgi:F0F1-type ATP synthase membrane subunit b/b'